MKLPLNEIHGSISSFESSDNLIPVSLLFNFVVTVANAEQEEKQPYGISFISSLQWLNQQQFVIDDEMKQNIAQLIKSISSKLN